MLDPISSAAILLSLATWLFAGSIAIDQTSSLERVLRTQIIRNNFSSVARQSKGLFFRLLSTKPIAFGNWALL
jgi:hypothetical protein